jgi:hypothetical protein
LRASTLHPSFSKHIPSEPDEGVLYVSMEYATAVHLCACGCKSKVVTPLGQADWQLTFDGTVSLRPSIGNGLLPCRSHYHIRHDAIEWMRPISAEATRAALSMAMGKSSLMARCRSPLVAR